MKKLLFTFLAISILTISLTLTGCDAPPRSKTNWNSKYQGILRKENGKRNI